MNRFLVAFILVISCLVKAEPAIPSGDPTSQALEVELKKITEAPEANNFKAPDEEKKIPVDESQPVFKEPSTVKALKEPSSSNIWLKMGLSLLIVLSLMGAVVWGFKKSTTFKKKIGKAPMIELLSQMAIGNRKSLAVVKVAGEAALIGITDQNISLLKSLTLLDEEIPAPKFTKSLRKALAPEEDTEEFAMKGLKEIVKSRLKNLKEI